MSYEAVPCMFRGKAEDGNEASLFGLLIRPSSSTATSATNTAALATSSAIQGPSVGVPLLQKGPQASSPHSAHPSSSSGQAPQGRKRRRRSKKSDDLQLVNVGSVMVDPSSLMGAMKSGGATLQIAGMDGSNKDLFSMQQLAMANYGGDGRQAASGLSESSWLVSQSQPQPQPHDPQPTKRRRRASKKPTPTQPMQLAPPKLHNFTATFEPQQEAFGGAVGDPSHSLLIPSSSLPSSSSYPNYPAAPPACGGYNGYVSVPYHPNEAPDSFQQPFLGGTPLQPAHHHHQHHPAAPAANNPYHSGQEWHPQQPLLYAGSGSNPANNPNHHHQQQQNGQHLLIAAPPVGVYSATPDSGIQSIDGSPPSISSSFTPPMVSPYAQVASCDSTHSSLHYPNSIPQMSVASTSSSATTCPKGDDCRPMSTLGESAALDLATASTADLSDMPVLVPIIDEQPSTTARETANELDSATSDRGWLEEMSVLDENGPQAIGPDTTAVKAAGSSTTTSEQGEQLLFAVTSSMDLSELAERLYSNIDKDQLDQLTRLIQSKAGSTLIDCVAKTAPSTRGGRQSASEVRDNGDNVDNGDSSSQTGSTRPATATDGESDRWLNAYRNRVRSRMSRRVEELLNGRLSQRFASALHLERTVAGRATPQKRCRPTNTTPFPWLRRIDWRSANRRVSAVDSRAASTVKSHGNISSLGFVPVKSNVMLQSPEVRASANCSAIAGCQCSLQAPCSADSCCVNRELRRECTADTCGLPAAHCLNRRISKEAGCPPAQLEVFNTPGSGRGLRTRAELSACAYVGEYVGEAMRRSTFLRRYAAASEREPRYGVELCAGYVVDAMKKGNLLRFVNHSCTPNCELHRWTVDGQPRLALFTLRRIEAGEELTYHYGTGHVGLDPPQQCRCGLHTGSSAAVMIPSAADRRKRRASTTSHPSRCDGARSSEVLAESGGGPSPSLVHERQAKRSAAAQKSLSEFQGAAATAAGASPLPEISHLLVKLFDDFSSFCRRKERIPERRLRLVRKAAQKALMPPPAADVGAASVLLSFDAAMKQNLAAFRLVYDPRRSASITSKYIELKQSLAAFASELQQPQNGEGTSPLSICNETWVRFTEGTKTSDHPARERKTACANNRKQPATDVPAVSEADLSYMDSGFCAVGSYNPDELGREALLAAKANSVEGSGEDFVRCICGIMEDDGVMTQCERCSFWLHAACLDFDVASSGTNTEFVCDFCTLQVDVTPQVDIVLRPQPKVRLDGCTYYRTLVNPAGLQVRVNEAVYVERPPSDEHKTILRNLHERISATSSSAAENGASPAKKRRRAPDSCGAASGNESAPIVPNAYWEPPLEDGLASCSSALYRRRDLRIFRVERLFKGPSGHRFVFGCYYARPHETFCDSSRLFHKNELFWTPFFDTLPLEAVVGRCLVMPPQVWQLGRPKSPRYREEDVFVCEHQVDRNQRSFERIAQRDHYHIGTESYVFDHFDTELALKRDFTPFIVNANEAKTVAGPSSTPAESSPPTNSSSTHS